MDEIAAWYRSSRPHVLGAYRAPASPVGVVALPALRRLADVIAYPGDDVLCRELSVGFDRLGPITPGTGWRRLDGPSPPAPVHREDFMKASARYARACFARCPTEHSAVLLKQILEERELGQLGRIFGPCRAPPQWGRRTVPVPQELATSRDQECPLLPPPPSPAVALAFPIVTLSDADVLKVRRGEGWRRSGHNATTQVVHKPHHHRVDRRRRPLSVQGPRTSRYGGTITRARHCPLSDPSSAFLVLPTAAGPMLLCHAVMVFGALGAVWGYGRQSDLLVHLARCLLAIPTVDDFGGVAWSASAPSAFSAFEDFNTCFGYVMKNTRQPPAPAQAVQGVVFELRQQGVFFRPKPARVRRMGLLIDRILAKGVLTPATAGSMAGKSGFLATTCHGRLGRAPAKPLYARQARQHQAHSDFSITTALRSALFCLRALFRTAPRREFLFESERPTPILYADAFFSLGDKSFRPGHAGEIPLGWRPQAIHTADNGWGVVLFPANRACGPADVRVRESGSVPPAVLQRFATRHAFIFILQALAQCLPLWALGLALAGPYWSFVDNTAAQHALTRGYSGNAAANAVVSAFWVAASVYAASPCFERVPSKANISDAISRRDFAYAEDQEWRHLDFDFTRVYTLLADFVDSSSFDVEPLVRDIVEDLSAQRLLLGLYRGSVPNCFQ